MARQACAAAARLVRPGPVELLESLAPLVVCRLPPFAPDGSAPLTPDRRAGAMGCVDDLGEVRRSGLTSSLNAAFASTVLPELVLPVPSVVSRLSLDRGLNDAFQANRMR